jgi:hypothetical protein
LCESRPGRPYFVKPIILERDPMFTTWRKPAKTGAAAR